jgi:hypothetical protein
MTRVEHFLAIIADGEPEEIELARDSVSRQDLGGLAEAYWSLPDWEQKLNLVNLVQDHVDARLRDVMLDCLRAPDADQEYVQQAQAIAVCHLEENLDNFTTYNYDRQILARAVRRYLGPRQEDLAEIKALVKKGAHRLNVFFYAGIAVGILMGPLVLAVSFIPAAVEFLQVGAELTIMRGFGGGMTLLFVGVIGEQYLKVRKDWRILAALDENGDAIAWVYKVISTGRVQSVPGGSGATAASFTHVYFHLADGSSSKVWLRNKEADRLISLVRDNFWGLCTGYSKDLEKEYAKDPAALQEDPRHVTGVKRVTSTVRT